MQLSGIPDDCSEHPLALFCSTGFGRHLEPALDTEVVKVVSVIRRFFDSDMPPFHCIELVRELLIESRSYHRIRPREHPLRLLETPDAEEFLR